MIFRAYQTQDAVSGNIGVPAQKAATDLLSCYLAAAWVALTLYGSLYPFSDWQMAGDPLAFVEWAWPRYWSVFDCAANVVVYVPTGFLLMMALRRLLGRGGAAVAAIFLASLLSFTLEALQAWLPSRFSSNLDWACNTLGASLGCGVAGCAGEHLSRWWHGFRASSIASLPYVDIGLTLLGLWLLTLLSPEILLFGVGDLRQILPSLPTLPYDPETYHSVECAVIVSNFLAIGLFCGAMTRGRWRAYWVTPCFFLLAALARSLGAATLMGADAFFAWWTPSVRAGLMLAAPLLALALLLPPLWRLTLAALGLLAGAMLVNLTPQNPYSYTALMLWKQGHFLNFNGLTRWVATVWPFLALPYLFVSVRKV
ncbi:MAG: VanZ family protein [Zoogloeaceae bacterium]|jgi:VanZ family protein|nr:VanZ family protein [Zoogloeaceae bacterium]